jgi:hypothetical protein
MLRQALCPAAAEITKAAYELESYKQIMGVIARRLQDQGEDWRHVYKSLLLLEYMAKHGPQKVVYSHLGLTAQCLSVRHPSTDPIARDDIRSVAALDDMAGVLHAIGGWSFKTPARPCSDMWCCCLIRWWRSWCPTLR